MESHKYKTDSLATIKPGPQNPNLFIVGVIYTGNDKQLEATLRSILRQKLAGVYVSALVFHDYKKLPQINTGADITYVPYQNPGDFYAKFITTIEQSQANYCTVLFDGDEFFDGAFDAVDKIFTKYSDVNWLTGIQAYQSQSGFNITMGNTAMRRWSPKIYERNVYKNSGRYIPAASTFWRKSIWNTVIPQLHFVSPQTFCEDLWIEFLKSQKLYTCKVYFSSSRNYNSLDKRRIKHPNSYTPIEESNLNKIKEFFFINNIPYLRLFYRKEYELSDVIRFDHNTQAYFLSEY